MKDKQKVRGTGEQNAGGVGSGSVGSGGIGSGERAAGSRVADERRAGSNGAGEHGAGSRGAGERVAGSHGAGERAAGSRGAGERVAGGHGAGERVADGHGAGERVADSRGMLGTGRHLTGGPAALRAARTRAILRHAVGGAAYVALGWVLGGCRMAFGTYPLGLAAVCAAPKGVSLIVAGAVAASFALTENGGLLTGACLIAIALRVLARLLLDRVKLPAEAPPTARIRTVLAGLFGESPQLRMTAGAVCGFLVSLWSLVGGGFHYYDMFGSIFSILFTPVAVMLLSWCLGDAVGWRRTVGRGALMCALSFALRGTAVWGVSPAAFGIFFVVLYISSHLDVVRGAAAGLVCGVAFDPVCSPIFVMAAIIQGVLGPFSTLLSVGTALTAGILWGLYMEGLSSLTRLLPGLVLAATAYCGAARVGWLDRPAAVDEPEPPPDTSAERVEASEGRMLDMSGAFASLSRVFYELSDRVRRPGLLDLRRVCDSVFDRHCPDCPRREVCWGLEYGVSLDMVARLATALGDHGRALPEVLPERTRTRCRDIERICREINVEVGQLTEAVLRSEKLSLFALDYEAVSRLLCDAVEQQRQEYGQSEALAVAVSRALEGMGLGGELAVYGGRRRVIRIGGLDPERARLESGQLRRCLETAVGCRLEEPVFSLSCGRVEATLTSRRCCSVVQAGLCVPSEEDAPCGDSIRMFEDGHDRFYALISDGMGSGSEAAFCSGLVTVFLEKMLSAGNGVETSLRMLNGVLRSKGGAWESECSATVDLFTLDLLSGQASVIKSGAAPTYVRRGGDVFRLRAETVPLGILNAIDARRTSLELMPGDVVIMVSDGVTDAGLPLPGQTPGGSERDCPPSDGSPPDCSSPEWLEDVLSLEWDDDLDLMAHRITGRAQSVGGRDDLSVILVRVEEY